LGIPPFGGAEGFESTLAAFALDTKNDGKPIDRQALVQRHNIHVTKLDPYSALTVGNGEFAFTADITGLQTFLPEYDEDFPLCTASNWGWHTTPAPAGVNPADFKYKDFDTHGRPVGYATSSTGQETLFNWMRENPHRMHLGRLGLLLTHADGSPAKSDDLKNIDQTLDLWTGVIDSRFEFDGKPVRVITCCDPQMDQIAVRIESPLASNRQLRVLLAFAYPSSDPNMVDWKSVDRHQTEIQGNGGQFTFARVVDNDRYHAQLSGSFQALLQQSKHEFVLSGDGSGVIELSCGFSVDVQPHLSGFSDTRMAAQQHWQKFWTEGGAVDLSGSTDPRATEIERRIILSQYNTALHCAGSLPPQETGLLFNSWYGKFHLEMHWWHAVHFTMWNRFPLFEKSLSFYERILPVAQATAKRQGFAGARWPKMVGPDGHDSPSPVGPLLIWQQPHPIYYAELCYQRTPDDKTLDRWKKIVFESADFMASYAFLDVKRNQYVLGPPMKTVSENADTLTTTNPTFELSYWRFGLQTAQAWRKRLGLDPDPKYADVLNRLAMPAVQDGAYLMQEGMTDTYTKWNYEHPALIGALGMQPGEGIDPTIMRTTVQRVIKVWQWDKAWGWDFPMMAMAAARVGEPELAVQALLIDVPKNLYHPNGHNYQRPKLTAYLPGNGGFLSAVAMMAAGWRGDPETPAPGFPSDGKWVVRYENLGRWL
jgi:hypothetical protein